MIEFDASFFEEEVREGFTITKMMKRAWAAQMEVLAVIDDVCRKNGIQYFADSGTLLGAVRHQGFIPWDDDIDICLRREEYMRLIAALKKDLPKGFALAGMYSPIPRLQEASFVPHARVIADELQWDFNDYVKYFHGFPYLRAGIDIFPMDYMASSEELLNLQRTIFIMGVNLLRDWDLMMEQGTFEKNKSDFEAVIGRKIEMHKDVKNEIWKTIDAVSALVRREEATDIFNLCFWSSKPKLHVKKECFDETVYLPFENIKVPAPARYDELLTAEYGDYWKPVKNLALHGYPFYGHMEADLKEEIAKIGFEGTIDEFCDAIVRGDLRV